MQAELTPTEITPSAGLRGPGAWPSRLGKYWAIARMSIINQFAYVGEALLRAIFLVLIIFVFVQLWNLTYGVLGRRTIGEYSLPQMIWYFAFAEAIILSVPLLRRKVDDDVKTGELAYRLTKPYHYLLYLAADYLGEWSARFVINLAIGCALALLLVGPIAFTWWGVGFAVIALAGAVVLDLLGALAVSLTAFWVEDTGPFYLIYRRLVMLLGGMMIPLDVFPEPLSSIARALPFSYMVYGPARLWVAPTPEFFTSILPGLGVFLFLAGLIVWRIYASGQRNVVVNGG